MAKWIVAEKSQSWRHAVICPNMMGRMKERIPESKRARFGSLAIVEYPQVAQTCTLRANAVLSFSGVTFEIWKRMDERLYGHDTSVLMLYSQ